MHRSFLTFSALLVVLVLPGSVAAQPPEAGQAWSGEELEIQQSLRRYIDGTSTNDPALTLSAFYEGADLFLSHPERPLWIVPIGEYAERLGQRTKGEPNGRTGKVLSIERHGDIASASAEIVLPDGRRFVDIFLLKRLEGQWKILSKAATQVD